MGIENEMKFGTFVCVNSQQVFRVKHFFDAAQNGINK